MSYNFIMNQDIALLPLDNRPVSFLLPKQVAEFAGINLLLPERRYLGDLKNSTNLDYIEEWLIGLDKNTLLILSLDTWVYGGLVQSRQHERELNYLLERNERLENIINKHGCKYAFSSVMRIANYNNNEEEKSYWDKYGEKIFKWSEYMHRVGKSIKIENETYEDLIDSWYESSNEIPPEIIADYKSLRDKNLRINLEWLKLVGKSIDYLLYSKDDSSEYGINVVEANYLEKQIKDQKIKDKAKVILGADEIPLLLITKSQLDEEKPSVGIFFSSDIGKNITARYESTSIEESIKSKLEVLGLELVSCEDADIVLCVHVAKSIQGDHVFGIEPESTEEEVKRTIDFINNLNKPFIVLDIAYANGADPKLIKKMSSIDMNKLYGFSAWNTCSNSTGTALAMGVNRWLAEKRGTFDERLFKKCLITRFLDDYGYQAKVRESSITEEKLNVNMEKYIKEFSKIFDLDINQVKCSLPWKRSFEVEISV